MARLNTLILNIARQITTDAELERLLFSAASTSLSREEYAELTRLISRYLYKSGATGYAWQSQLVGRPLTRQSLTSLVQRAGQMGQKLTSLLTGILEGRPEGITVTLEGVLAQSALLQEVTHGQLVSAEEHGLNWKIWVHAGEGKKERPAHAALHRVVKQADEYYDIGDGVEVLAPHDWTVPNPAWHFMNCRCQVIYLPSPEALDSLA